ncbi:MAG TPA: acylphosphatase [Gemmatimonadales bacterium]|nr:acylphosphatase [Gemmatimonadales bacterium]
MAAAFRFRIEGTVQGVGFRWFVARHATLLGLVGYARNQPDGSVEVVASGDEAAIDRLARELARGPEFAHVSAVEKTEIQLEVCNVKSFDIK